MLVVSKPFMALANCSALALADINAPAPSPPTARNCAATLSTCEATPATLVPKPVAADVAVPKPDDAILPTPLPIPSIADEISTSFFRKASALPVASILKLPLTELAISDDDFCMSFILLSMASSFFKKPSSMLSTLPIAALPTVSAMLFLYYGYATQFHQIIYTLYALRPRLFFRLVPVKVFYMRVVARHEAYLRHRQDPFIHFWRAPSVFLQEVNHTAVFRPARYQLRSSAIVFRSKVLWRNVFITLVLAKKKSTSIRFSTSARSCAHVLTPLSPHIRRS